MSSGSSHTGVPSGLAPIGGWKPDEGPASPSPLSPPPAAPLASVGQNAVPAPAAQATQMGGLEGNPGSAQPRAVSPDPIAPPAGAPRSRFDVPPPAAPTGTAPGPATSRFSATPVAAAPRLAAPEPQRERSYSVAGAYNNGEIPAMSSSQMISGIIAGVVVGAICTALWIYIFVALRFSWSTLIAPGVGYAIGWAVFSASKYGEETSCWIAGIISAIYCLIGIGTIQFLIYSWWGFPSITGLIFGVIALGIGAERGYRTPEIMAVNTAV